MDDCSPFSTVSGTHWQTANGIQHDEHRIGDAVTNELDARLFEKALELRRRVVK